MKEKILLDTDIGSDIDDAIALAYLLSNPECELLGITTVSGKVEERCKIADVICRKAGKDIPILPGVETSIITNKGKDVPQGKTLSKFSYKENYPVGEAIEFMRKTIRESPNEIILLTIGPLTNIALLFKIDSQIPSLLKGLYCMAGWFLDEKRNIESNVLWDPHAFFIVNEICDIIPYYIGLDVTLKTKLHKDKVREEFKKHFLLSTVLEFAEVWFEKSEYITFHDIVSASAVFTKDIIKFKKGFVDVEIENKETAGFTNFREDKKGNKFVAYDINVNRFFTHFFTTFK